MAIPIPLNSDILEVTYPKYKLVPGEKIQILVKIKNTGQDNWHTDYQPSDTNNLQGWYHQHYFAATNANAKNSGPNEIEIPDHINTSGVYDKTGTMIFTITVPSAGTRTFTYQMCQRNKIATGPMAWNYRYDYFGEIVSFTLTILAIPDSELVSLVFPATAEVADKGIANITLTNTGPWTWDYTYRIEIIDDDTDHFSKSWYYIPLGVTVPPNKQFTFVFSLRAPATPGTYRPKYRMYWSRCGLFGDIATKTVTVTKPMAEIKNLDDYPWISMSARRSTADIAWQYDISIHGTDYPEAFGKLIHEEDGKCALCGAPVEYDIEYDYPSISTNVAAYSYGYFLSNRLPWRLRQSRAGADIKAWQKADANITAIQARTAEIKTYENPSDYIKRILFYVNDTTGAIDTSRAGPYGLWATDNPSNITEGMATIRPVPNWGINKYTGSDGNQYDDTDAIPSGVTKTLNSNYNNKHPTTGDPGMIEKKQFAYDGDKIIDVLDEIAEHCHMIYYTRFIKVEGVWREYFYWIPKYGTAVSEKSKLNMFGVSTTITSITPDTKGLVGSPGLSATIVLEQNYNCVWVEACRKKDSAWFYAYKAGKAVSAGTEIPRALFYRTHDLLPDPVGNTWNGSITTSSNFGPSGKSYGTAAEDDAAQALVTKKAEQLIDLLDYNIKTFTATFHDTDINFELYQLVKFSDEFTGLKNFVNTTMQIIDIQFDYQPPDSGGHTVTITCASQQMLQDSGKFQSVIDEIQENFEKLKEDVDGTSTDNKVAIVLSTYSEGSMCTAQLRSTGALVKTRTYGYKTSTA